MIELSTSMASHVSLPYIATVEADPRHLELNLNRTSWSVWCFQ